MNKKFENTISKKKWTCPDLQNLDIKKTESGSPYSAKEDFENFDPDISPQG
jgi:hypothetical protein